MKRLALALLTTTSTVYADDIASIEQPKKEPFVAPIPAPTTTPAPRPDQASGVAHEDASSGSWLWLPRTLLVVPRGAFWLAVQPFRGAAYLSERLQLNSQPLGKARVFRFYPVAGYESTYGFTFGARAIVTNLLDRGERFKLRANWGGEFNFGLGGKLSTGERLGRVEISVDTSYESRGRERFHGIGDGPDLEAPPEMPIDPSVDSSSIRARFSEDLLRSKVVVKTELVGDLSSRVTGAFVDREFGAADSESIEMSYQTDKLAGFATGTRNVYIEHELAYDSRRPASPYATQTIDGTGWLLSGYVGLARGVEGDPTKYVRYGGEIQRYIDLYEGTRILTLRALVDAVGGTDGRTDGRISFVELPRLGGSEHLRGYASGRFRDRAVTLATAEYTWQVANHFTGYSFFDIGGALPSLAEVRPDKLRFGYGGGVQLHSKNSFYTRIQVAASREGDVFLDFIFSPAFGRRERAGRF